MTLIDVTTWIYTFSHLSSTMTKHCWIPIASIFNTLFVFLRVGLIVSRLGVIWAGFFSLCTSSQRRLKMFFSCCFAAPPPPTHHTQKRHHQRVRVLEAVGSQEWRLLPRIDTGQLPLTMFEVSVKRFFETSAALFRTSPCKSIQRQWLVAHHSPGKPVGELLHKAKDLIPVCRHATRPEEMCFLVNW